MYKYAQNVEKYIKISKKNENFSKNILKTVYILIKNH